MKSALTIAGSDPTGGAGLQADLRVFKAFGLHGLSIPSALTAQNTVAVEGILPVDKDFFIRQTDGLLRDIRPAAVKTGMLYSNHVVETVAEKIREYSLDNLVIDPVIVSSSGTALSEAGVPDKVRDLLFPLAAVITPNIYEASVFAGINIDNETDMEKAALKLKEMGPAVVVITGGHFEELRRQESGIRSKNDGETLDLIYSGGKFYRLRGKKIEGEYHGTGCAFSAAITAYLVLGHSTLASVRRAKVYVTESIRKAYHIGSGMGLLNI